jgi:hypothetical protein
MPNDRSTRAIVMAPPAQSVPCLHCERRPKAHYLGLCAPCAASRGVRLLYQKRRGWTPAWEAHLRRLTERARLRLPLFD